MATVGSYLVRSCEQNSLRNIKIAKTILNVGYAITWVSILFFIIQGFSGVDSNK